MGNDLDSIEATLETLFDEPFMAITKGPPEYEIDSHDGVLSANLLQSEVVTR